jgi:hypothetical protein
MKRAPKRRRPNAGPELAFGIGIATVLMLVLFVLSFQYRRDCLKAGGEVKACWKDSLEISGMGTAGALGPGAVVGWIVGAYNKEQEKREEYEKGYWTLNPDLHANRDSQVQ